jgi:hypothetical protein
MGSAALQTGAQDHHLEMLEQGIEDVWAVSVFAARDMTADEIALASPIPHPQIRVSTVGEVRTLGHDVQPCGYGLHADLQLRGKPDEDMCEELRGAFEEPRANPRLLEDDDDA